MYIACGVVVMKLGGYGLRGSQHQSKEEGEGRETQGQRKKKMEEETLVALSDIHE